MTTYSHVLIFYNDLFSLLVSRFDILTFAPRLANSKAIPAPIPREAPVTMAVLPAKVKSVMLAVLRARRILMAYYQDW